MQRILICWILALVVVLPASAQTSASLRPTINIMVRSVGQMPAGARNPFTPTAVSKTAKKILSARGYNTDVVASGPLPENAATLRLMYVVNERNMGEGGTLVAAAAASNLLQSVDRNNSHATLSLYNSVQQSVAQRASAAEARDRVKQAFSAELADRLSKAMDAYERYRGR